MKKNVAKQKSFLSLDLTRVNYLYFCYIAETELWIHPELIKDGNSVEFPLRGVSFIKLGLNKYLIVPGGDTIYFLPSIGKKTVRKVYDAYQYVTSRDGQMLIFGEKNKKPIVLFEEWAYINEDDIVMINESEVDNVNPPEESDED